MMRYGALRSPLLIEIHRRQVALGRGIAFESLPVAVVTVNPALRITGFYLSAKEVTGYSRERGLGQHCGDILNGELCKLSCPLRAVLSHRESVVRTESTICNKFGAIISVRQHAAGLLEEDESVKKNLRNKLTREDTIY